MKKIFTVLGIVFLLTSCHKQYEAAMKSADKNFILETANQYFEQKKWTQAIALYERLPNLVYGTDDARTVVFNTAYANYYDKQYRIAAHHFKNFSVTFTDDPRVEEAAYMSALCYYKGSLDYNLDQSNTESAINELQNFINKYPDSERSQNINQLIDELSYKLEFKAFENAKQYYKMAEYLAADVAFENVLEDYPGTKLRAKIYEHILRSKYELATKSIYSKKEDRIEAAIAYTRFIEKENSSKALTEEALNKRKKLEIERKNFSELKAMVEAEKDKLEAKQQAKAESAKTLKKEPNNKDTSVLKEAHMVATDTISHQPSFKIPRN